MIRSIAMKSVGMLAASVVALAAVWVCSGTANAAVLAQWTFETNTPADLNDSATGPTVAAESGTGSMVGVHASAVSDWSTPAGNGSANSYSVNTWAVGDYIQFVTSSTGYEDITLSWDQTSSATGPRDFELLYATAAAGPYTSAGTYVVLPNQAGAPGAGVWNGTTAIPAYSYTANLSAIVALENAGTISFRLRNTTTADSTPPGTVAAAGTNRVDNFTVNGTLTSVPVPAAAFVFMGVATIAGAARRRFQSLLS